MRMDRYEDEKEKEDLKQSRINKNQELYTDVYLNNAYIDINSLKDEIKEEKEVKKEELKEINNTYTYEEKDYDINELIKKAIENKEDDKLKRSLDNKINDDKLESLIQSINEQQKKEKEEKESDNLLSDLLPNNDTTVVVPPLSEPILDTSIIELSDDKTEKVVDDSLKNLEVDDSFVEKNGKGKIIVLIIIILLLISAVVGFLMYKGII